MFCSKSLYLYKKMHIQQKIHGNFGQYFFHFKSIYFTNMYPLRSAAVSAMGQTISSPMVTPKQLPFQLSFSLHSIKKLTGCVSKANNATTKQTAAGTKQYRLRRRTALVLHFRGSWYNSILSRWAFMLFYSLRDTTFWNLDSLGFKYVFTGSRYLKKVLILIRANPFAWQPLYWQTDMKLMLIRFIDKWFIVHRH